MSRTTYISATLGAIEGTTLLTVYDATLLITPDPASVAAGEFLQLTATYSGSSQSEVTLQSVWETLTPEVATIGQNTGEVEALGEGFTIVSTVFANLTATSDLYVTAAPVQPQDGMVVFTISGNPNYVEDVSALTYLEAYPMWFNGPFLSASAGTPNPPKTGHALFTYDDLNKIVTVTPSLEDVSWDGTGVDNTSITRGPWGNFADTYPPDDEPVSYIMKGYAGSSFTGSWTNDNTNWFFGSRGNPFEMDNAVQLVNINQAATQASFTQSINYYAARLAAQTITNQPSISCGVISYLTLPRVLYVVIYGDSPLTFANVTQVYMRDPGTSELGVSPFNFKILNNKEMLVWMPEYWNDGNPSDKYPESLSNGGYFTLRFIDSVQDWDSPSMGVNAPV